MKVADVAGLEPASMAILEGNDGTVESSLATKFFDDQLPGMTKPEVLTTQGPVLLLQQREEVAHQTENDEFYLLDDPKVHGKSKMNKAFCAPKDITFCPPIALASAFRFGFASDADTDTSTGRELSIKRAPDNGGDVVFKNLSELEASFSDESLHPGDFKAAATTIMMEVLDKLAAAIKADGDANKASKTLKALAKKLAKNKGKK
jgi:hypothetical protein